MICYIAPFWLLRQHYKELAAARTPSDHSKFNAVPGGRARKAAIKMERRCTGLDSVTKRPTAWDARQGWTRPGSLSGRK
jgi:hypothetical protein